MPSSLNSGSCELSTGKIEIDPLVAHGRRSSAPPVSARYNHAFATAQPRGLDRALAPLSRHQARRHQVQLAVDESMNNGGTPGGGHTVVGLFMDMTNQQHGYVVRDGMLTAYDPDGANLTAIWDINPSQQFVGTFRYAGEPASKRHGFVQTPDSSAAITLDFTCEDPAGCAGAPPGTVAFATVALGVNPDGLVVGQYALVAGGALHGFVAVPSDKP